MSNIEENDHNTLLQSVHHADFTIKDLKAFHIKNKDVKIHKLIYPKTGDSIIHVCARLGRPDFLEYIFNNWDLNIVDIKNNDDKTALHEASQFSQFEVVKLLLQYKAEINAIKRADWTPIMLACTKPGTDALEIIKLLIENGAILDLKNKDGWTALHLACREGDLKIVETLIEFNEDIVKLRTKNGRTALHIASLHGHINIVRKLLQYICPNEKDNSGNNALHEATFSENKDIINLLVSNGCDIYSLNNIAYSCLHLAASENLVDLIRFFISEYKIDVNLKSFSGLTALHCAARKKQNEAMKILILMGADVNIKDNHGRIANDYFVL